MPINYDNYVKKPGQEEEYTPEMIKELAKCSKDIFEFCKYVKIVHPDKGRVTFEPYEFQKDIIETFLENRMIILLLGRQVGKCICKDTKIKIRNRHNKKVKEIPIGNFFENCKGEFYQENCDNAEDKFIGTVGVSDYEVLSSNGWKNFYGIGKTKLFQKYKLTLNNGFSLEGADDHIVNTKNGFKKICVLKKNDLVETSEGFIKVKELNKLDQHENMYDLLNVDGKTYLTNDIVSHNSTVVAVLAVWYAIFNKDKLIGIASYIEREAISILDKIKIIYEELPSWIKPGVEGEYNKKSLLFDNGTKIMVSATTKNAFRGRSMNLVLSDELAFVHPNQAEEFWSSNYPTISKSQESKFIVISTPKGQYNLFHRLWVGATKGNKYKNPTRKRKPGPNGFVPIKYDWRCLPERDEEWVKTQKESLGPVLFRQEHEVEFLGSTNTLIDRKTLEKLLQAYKNPILYDLQNAFRVYEKPVEECRYVMGVDTAKGSGENFSTIQILRIDSIKPVKLEQVATYESNLVDPYHFSEIVNKISIYYNNSYIMCENNAEGSTVISELHWRFENSGLINTGNRISDLGIRADRKSKPTAVVLMKKLLEGDMLSLSDYETVRQLTDFVDRNNKFRCENLNDDLVSALYWAVYYIFKMNVLNETMSFKKEENDNYETWGILTDVGDGIKEDWSWL